MSDTTPGLEPARYVVRHESGRYWSPFGRDPHTYRDAAATFPTFDKARTAARLLTERAARGAYFPEIV